VKHRNVIDVIVWAQLTL